MLICFKNVTSVEKLPISNVESFLESNFRPKSNIQNSAYTKPLNLTQRTCFTFLWKIVEKLWSCKKCQKIEVGIELVEVRIKNLSAQTISVKILGKKGTNPAKLDRKRKGWYFFLHVV